MHIESRNIHSLAMDSYVVHFDIQSLATDSCAVHFDPILEIQRKEENLQSFSMESFICVLVARKILTCNMTIFQTKNPQNGRSCLKTRDFQANLIHDNLSYPRYDS